MDTVEVRIVSVNASDNSANVFSLLLEEKTLNKEKPRKLMVLIGVVEAQSILMSLKNINPTRPLTHDLFVTYILKSGASLSKVVIYKEANGVFYSMLHFILKDGSEMMIDGRTSDAVALALRMSVPIYVSAHIIDEQNDLIKESGTEGDVFYEDKTGKDNDLGNLEQQLKKAVDEEDYERASVLRDKINSIKNK